MKSVPLSTAQWDVLQHLQRFGPTHWGAFRGNVVAAIVRKNLAVIDAAGRLCLVQKEGSTK